MPATRCARNHPLTPHSTHAPTFQFVVLKPTMALASFICMLAGVFETVAFQWVLLVVYNLSYTTALYGLFLFYLGTKSLLVGFSPVSKFSAVKVIVFATYYQSLIVVALPGMDELGSSERWNDFIICIEMAMFAVMHECVPIARARAPRPPSTRPTCVR